MEDTTAALERMATIEARLGTVEANAAARAAASASSAGKNGAADKAALVEFQKQMIVRLKDVRSAMEASGGDITAITAERDAALTENAQLKKDAERLNYRVAHLVKMLNIEEAKNSNQ